MTVFLVGAGPGDPGLLTVRGLELIKRADVILYDRLVNPSILDHAKGKCIKVFVGKEPGHHTKTQDEINKLLVKYGSGHDCVVRLKGGDPFVFGRGGEEMESLIENGIPFEIVPGITSAIAGPSYAGIPVTHRGNNTSVTFITGHRWDSSRIRDTYGKLSGTLVILMGAGSFPEIGRDLMSMGYGPQTNVSAIHNATLSSQSVISGTLKELTRSRIPSPSVIVVGGAQFPENEARWFERKLGAIKGKKVLVMRTMDQFGDTKAMLEEVGASAVNGGFYELIPVGWDKGKLENATHVVITSANTVPILKEELLANRDKTYVAIGPGTRKSLESIGISAEMPDEYTSEGLGMLLKKIVGGEDRVVGLRSSKASNVLGSMLSDIDYKEIPVYDIDFGAIYIGSVTDADVIFFTSTAMVNAISHLVKEEQIRISIGPQTTATMNRAGIPPHMESVNSTIESMIGAALDILHRK